MKQAPFASLSPFSRLLFAIAVSFTSFMLFFLISLLLAIPFFHQDLSGILALLSKADDPAALPLLEYFQVTQSIGLFIFPALICAYLFGGRDDFLRTGNSPGFMVYLIVLVLMFISLPFVNSIVSLNESMKLPSWLSPLEEWMKSSEAQAEKLTGSFLKGTSFPHFLFNLFMIGILPALGEEFMFRGLLQRLIRDWTRSSHAAVWIAAFLFAAMHLQFYGIIPRMLLGAAFGYLFLWTGSIWVPVFAHFVNNSGAVVISYLSNLGVISEKYQEFGSTDNIMLIILSFLLSMTCMLIVYRRKPI
jgi:membrane protease YdiL (CAAX protease family)